MRGTLRFSRPTDVIPDGERPGLLRARPVHATDDGDAHVCELHDLAAPGSAEPGLEQAGFQTVDLSRNMSLQRALSAVRRADHLSNESAVAIRDSLTGAVLGLGEGKALRVDHVVDDGLFHRRSGPNGLDVNPGGIDGSNGHSGARHVHGDQDVFGTPLRQLMHGAAPEVFRHVSPDGRNDDAQTFLLNLWIPLHAPVQPLVLLDRRSLDASRHQLRYGLPVEGFLERDADAAINDIWAFLYDEGQRWFVRTDMGPTQGYVFDTLGAAHGAAVLAGEEALAELYVALHRRCEAFESGETASNATLSSKAPSLHLPEDATATIGIAWQTMTALVERADALLHAGADAADPAAASAWCADARAAMDAVIRRSIELRLVATLVAA